jgi:hypothetical protein
MSTFRLHETLLALSLLAPRVALAAQPPAGGTEPVAPGAAAPTVGAQPGVPVAPANASAAAAGSPAPAGAPVELPSLVSKFKVQFYGFTELDMIHDTTQSYNELAGDGLIARPGTYGGEHSRMMFSARNSRLGFRVGGPSLGEIKTSAVAEMDFLGNQPANPPALGEGAFFTNPSFRIRHMAFKLETPYVDVLAGQSWALFGWQPYFDPASVQIQGLPGEVFSRTPQLRLSHTFKTDPVNVEVAVAAARPPQREGDAPDGQGGLRLSFNDWKGYRTVGSAGTSLDSAALGVSGTVRNFTVQEFSATPASSEHATGWGVSVDGMIPVLPATQESHENALSLTASFATGTGYSDNYTGLNGGITFPRLTNADGTTVAFTPSIDNGLVTYDPAGNLHTIDWNSVIVGAQYYLPFGGLWLAADFSHMHSGNIAEYGAAATSVITDSTFIDGNLFWDVVEGVRFGAEYSHFEQKYADDTKARNERIQISSFYIF